MNSSLEICESGVPLEVLGGPARLTVKSIRIPLNDKWIKDLQVDQGMVSIDIS